MKIKIDYWLREDGQASRLMHTEVSDVDIKEMLKEKFINGDLPCPMNFNRETVSVEFDIDSVIV